MEALIAFGIVITLALGAVRMGTLALQRTGLSRESASFQAQSAFMGVGFTTSESETVVNHPVRRRILRMLMWGGYSGITVTVSTIVSGVGSSDGHLLRFLGLMLVTAGVLLSVWQITSVRELADQLRGTRSDLRVLFTSGYPTHPSHDGAGLPVGGNFLAKPFTAAALREAVREALRG